MKEKDNIINDIMEKKNVVILDPGGVIWDELSLTGYENSMNEIKEIPISNPNKSIPFNLFDYVRTEEDISRTSRQMVESILEVDPGDHRLYEAAINLITYALAFIIELNDDHSFHGMLNLITACRSPDIPGSEWTVADDLIAGMTCEFGESQATRTYKQYKLASYRTRTRALALASERISWYTSPRWEKSFEYRNIDWMPGSKSKNNKVEDLLGAIHITFDEMDQPSKRYAFFIIEFMLRRLSRFRVAGEDGESKRISIVVSDLAIPRFIKDLSDSLAIRGVEITVFNHKKSADNKNGINEKF